MKYGHGFALLSVASACCYFALSPLSLSLSMFYGTTQSTVCKARLNNAGLQKISFCSSLRAAWESPRSLLQKAVLSFFEAAAAAAAALLWHSCMHGSPKTHFLLETKI